MSKTITRVEVDISGPLKEMLGSETLIKDLSPREHVCTQCKGLGMRRWHAPFAFDAPESTHSGFPYDKQSLTWCGHCYDGVQKVCEFCGKDRPKIYTRDHCQAEGDARRAKEGEVEHLRILNAPKVTLDDYIARGIDCLYDDDNNEFIYDFDDLDHTHTYFACIPTRNWIHVDPDDIIERLRDRAAEDCEDGGDMIDLADNAEEALLEVLNAWMDKYVKVSQIYFPNREEVVLVTAKDVLGDDYEEEEAAPEAAV